LFETADYISQGPRATLIAGIAKAPDGAQM